MFCQRLHLLHITDSFNVQGPYNGEGMLVGAFTWTADQFTSGCFYQLYPSLTLQVMNSFQPCCWLNLN